MPRKRHQPEEIVAKLRQVDVLTSRGQSVADAIRSIGVTEVTYYRWRQEYGGLKSDLGPDAGHVDPSGGCPGKLLSPARSDSIARRNARCHRALKTRSG